MTWPMTALMLGLGLTFGALRAVEGLDSRRGSRDRVGRSRAAGAGSACPARAPRRRHVARHFGRWSEKVAHLFLAGGAVRFK